MPQSRYLNISIDKQRLDITSAEELALSISYKLEDPEDFQTKKGSESFDVTVPATVNNDQVSNTFHDPSVEDMTLDQDFKRYRLAIIEANGIELLIGKCLLKKAGHDRLPIDYTYDFYGNAGNWMIDLKEKTLFDFLRHINFAYTKANLIASWDFDGTDENLPYVFAPVRYGLPMEPYYTNLVMNPPPLAEDYNLIPTYLKPSISKYWLLYWGFKSIGYRIVSDFFDTEYFRRQVLLWTWGNFNSSSGTRLDNLDFLAKSTASNAVIDSDFEGILDLFVSNDSTNGAFDNSGVYNYDQVNFEMKYTYPLQFQYGTLEHHFHISLPIEEVTSNNSKINVRLQFFKNGAMLTGFPNTDGNGTLILDVQAPGVGVGPNVSGVYDKFVTINLDPGDVFSIKVWVFTRDSDFGRAQIRLSVDAFELEFIRIPLGGTIDFENYTFLNKWKFLDFFRGVIDEFNLTVGTDPTNKVVYIEPTHPYSLADDQSIKTGGYLNGHFIDWENKQDLLKRSDLSLFDDSDRELVFKYKNDGADGCLKLVQDRNVNTLAAGKYVFPDRFKAGKKEIENRFFSPTMHYDVIQWTAIGTMPDPPQMICIVPENIANTSADEAQNTFEPKSAYYKGLTTDWGWVFDTEKTHPYPFMFAVNYKPGGEDDPILSYSDERIGGGTGSASGATDIAGKGLLKRFYQQRLAIMRNGQYYDTFFKLNNIDVTNWLHREHIVCRGQKWELVEIKDYKPLLEETTGVFMRKWSPVTVEDKNNTFPSEDEVLDIVTTAIEFEIPYAQLKCLASDIPK